MTSQLLIDREPRPDFSDLVPPGEPTYAISWRGDAGLSGCGCGCGECQGPTGGCGCSRRQAFDHLDVVADGWDGPGGCGGTCSGAKGGCGAGGQSTNTGMMRPAATVQLGRERVLVNGLISRLLGGFHGSQQRASNSQGSRPAVGASAPWTASEIPDHDVSAPVGRRGMNLVATHGVSRTYTAPRPCPSGDEYRDWDLPWWRVDSDCLPINPADGRPYNGAFELEDLCDLPCKRGPDSLSVPSNAEAEALVAGLNVDVGGRIETPRIWENLVQCAWALLKENIDLVQFAACVAQGPGGALSGCLTLEISWDRPTVHVWPPPPTGFTGGTVFPLDDLWNDLWLLLPGWLMGLLDGDAKPDDVILFTPTSFYQLWTSSDPEDRACGCALMAGLLLHELVHICGEDLNDWLQPDQPCDLADILASNFLWLLEQRYPDVEGCTPVSWFEYSGESRTESDSLEDMEFVAW